MEHNTVRLPRRRTRNAEAGYNLVEVLIAMALLGTVMISIMTLFFAGRGNVYSGRQMTQAVAVGTSAMEDLSSLDVTSLLGAFLITNATAVADINIEPARGLPASEYPASILRSTQDLTQEANPPGFLARWLNTLESQNKLADGRIFVVITPENGPSNPDTPTVADASLFRVRVIVRWVEGPRQRQAIFDTVKFRR